MIGRALCALLGHAIGLGFVDERGHDLAVPHLALERSTQPGAERVLRVYYPDHLVPSQLGL